MYQASITVRWRDSQKSDDIVQGSFALDQYLTALKFAGNVTSIREITLESARMSTVYVTVAEDNALDSRWISQFGRDSYDNLRTHSDSIEMAILGRFFISSDVCGCSGECALTIRSDVLPLESVALCASCGLPIPLYRIRCNVRIGDGRSGEFAYKWRKMRHQLEILGSFGPSAIRKHALLELNNGASSFNKYGRETAELMKQQTGLEVEYIVYVEDI